MRTFFQNGIQSSDRKIKEDSKLFEWLEDNKCVYGDEIHITKETLEELKDVEMSVNDEILVGELIFNLEYHGGYIFIAKDDIYCCEHKWCITDGRCPGFDHELGGW